MCSFLPPGFQPPTYVLGRPLLSASLSPATPRPFGSRAGARAVNDCPARGPDPYLHSSAPSPARPPANLRPDTGRPAPAPGRMLRAVV